MELEHLRDRFKQEGHKRVAVELDLILSRYGASLPPSLSLKGANTESTEFNLTPDLLEKPEYTPRLLDMFDTLVPPDSSDRNLRRVVAMTKQSLMFYYSVERSRQASMREILDLSDSRLLKIPGFGPVSLRTFKSGKELIQHGLAENQS